MPKAKALIAVGFLLLGPALATVVSAAATSAPAGDPASFEISVAPAAVQAGGDAQVSLRLVPAKGIKINRYPKIKLVVAEQPNLVGAVEGVLGNSEPPPADKLDANYFTTIDPLTVSLSIASAAAKGRHEIPARLSYFYCVAASGYCAPAKVQVKIPIIVR
jgi:hypothetical protein